MCGICGVIEFNNKSEDISSLASMMKIIKHRGPDDEGVYSEENIALGFVRLSIIDLTPAGHQPMISEDGDYVIVFNGEIYNYIELREELIKLGYSFRTNTDTEVLLSAYREWGKDCMHRFNGMWAFVIYNRKDKTVFASRDRFGVKPFYYYIDDDRLVFASEIPAILAVMAKKPLPNYQSIFDFLVFNRTDQTEATFFEGIKKLQHGHQLTIIENKVSISKWYDLRTNLKEPFSTVEEFKEYFSSSLGLRLRSDVPVGVCLSGGLDSSSIVSILLKDFDKQDLNTFSAVYEKGQYGDESEFIKEYVPLLKNMYYTTPTAETLKNDLKNFVKAHAEPIPSTSPYAQFKVMELAKGKVVVTLDGQGADEELAGYHYFFGFYFKDLLRNGRLLKLFKEIYYYTITHKSLFGIKTFLYFLLPKRLRTSVRVNEKSYINKDFVKRYSQGNSIAGNLYGANTLNEALINHFEFKLEHLLKWEDRNSMWFSLESRVPFLDYRLVERVLATPGDMVINNGMTKHLLREGMKGILPEKIRLRRDKIGFDTPQDEWFRTPEWKEIVYEVLKSDTFKNRNLVDPEIALSQYHKHLAGKINVSKEIWKWVHLELWFREFVD